MAAQLKNLQTNKISIIDKTVVTIGKEESYVDIVLSDSNVSRAHCQIINKENDYYLVDLNSTNHTFLNGQLITPKKEHSLKFGDQIMVASEKFIFEEAHTVKDNYDVFISFKNCEVNGMPGIDVKMAESLYHALRKKGYNPFFSKYSIDESGRSNYMTVIAEALERSKNFVMVGSCYENITSDWVTHEYEIFSNLWLREGRKTRSIVTYRSKFFPAIELPAHLTPFQSFDNEEGLIRFIDACINGNSSLSGDAPKKSATFDAYNINETTVLNNFSTTSPLQSGVVQPPVMPPKTASELKPGEVLYGKYEILTRIGKGGFSNVYLANDKKINRRFAVKEYIKKGSKDFEAVLDSIKKEVSFLKYCNHPAIPAIIDTFENTSSYIIVMNYVEGSTLKNILETTGPQPEYLVIDIATQLCNFLDYIHSLPNPIIYRDMKPANIMLDPDGMVKIVDFGTTREYKMNSLEDTTCLGTRGYAAPEQYGGMGQTDARTDIYGLGVTLYHLVTGQDPAMPPYEIQPIRSINPALSKELETIIKKCTCNDPSQRYQSAKELMKALESVDSVGKKSLFKRKPPKNHTSEFGYGNSKGADAPVNGPAKPFFGRVQPVGAPIRPNPIKPPINTPAPAPIPVKPSPAIPQPTGFAIPGQVPTTISKKPDPRLAEAMAKLISLDPTNQEIIFQLIDKLSK